MDFDLIILGAGAAGMMAAVAAGEALAGTGARIAIFEKNIRPGIKVLVCGGGRCNFTNAGSVDFLIGQFGRCGRFLAPALHHLDNEALRKFFADAGVPSHIEPGGKVYPDSNQAKSVVDALVRRMEAAGVHIFAGPSHAAAGLVKSAAGFALTTAGGETHTAGFALLAVGGMSYQRMGTVGDGYRIAESLGHSMVTPRPAIVGLITQEEWIKPLQGLAVRGIDFSIAAPGGENQKSKSKNRKSHGDLLFTHFGISGPAVLNPSEVVAELLETQPAVVVQVDFAPGISHQDAHALLRLWQQKQGKNRFKAMLSQRQPASPTLIRSTSPDQTDAAAPETRNAKIKPQNSAGASAAFENRKSETETLKLSLPLRLAEALCTLEYIVPEQPCSQLSSSQIHRLVERIKGTPFTISATRGFKEAMVTAGGVALQEVNPHTLESKITPDFFLTGEVLDLTGPSGGYNLQLAFSTGHLAGTRIAERIVNKTRRD